MTSSEFIYTKKPVYKFIIAKNTCWLTLHEYGSDLA
jgi:hypothetical protein